MLVDTSTLLRTLQPRHPQREIARAATKAMVEGVPPVNVPSTAEWAAELEEMLHMLRLVAEPFFDETGAPSHIN